MEAGLGEWIVVGKVVVVLPGCDERGLRVEQEMRQCRPEEVWRRHTVCVQDCAVFRLGLER